MSENLLLRVSRKLNRQASSLGLINRLLPAASRFAVPILATTLLLLGLSSGYALSQWTETFTGGFGSWTTQYGLTDNGFNLGWANTANAGGGLGEIGGSIAQYTSTATPSPLGMPRILDPLGGGTLNLNSPLSVSGRMWLQEVVVNPNMNVHMGYYNLADPSNQNLMLRIVAASSTKRWRFQFRGNGSSGSRVTAPDTTWDSTPLGFSFTWAPSGLNDGAGTISGQLTKGADVLTVTSYNVAANTSVFDSFGLWVDSGNGTLADVERMWFDDLVYTVPEPSAALLLPLGAGLLLLARRNLRRV